MDKKLAAQRFEVSRALRKAHHLVSAELVDPREAMHELAQAVASIAIAVDQLLEIEEMHEAHL